MRAAHLTKNRQAQIHRSLQLLEQSYSAGNITSATYIQRKDDLSRLLNQSRTLNQSPLAKNPASWFSRNVVNHSSAPVGFLEAMGLKKPKQSSQTYPQSKGQFWQPSDFLNTNGLKTGQKAHNGQTAPAPAITSSMANQMVNQGWNRASNAEIRKSLLEASNRETWNDIDIQSVLNNQESSYQTSVESAGTAGGLGLTVTNLPSYDRFSKETVGTYQAEAIVHAFIQAVSNLDFSRPNIMELIENESRSAAIRLYHAQILTEDIQPILVNAIVGTSSEILNSFEALEAVNNGADVMNQVKTGPESRLFNSFYNTFENDNMSMNPSMTDPFKAIDLPTLYAMAEEAIGNEANQIQAEIVSRQDAMKATRRSSKTSKMKNNATGRGYNNAQAIKNRIATNKAFETSTAALQAQKADLFNVIDDILTIDGKLILDITTGQFNAFVTEMELKNAIMGINYALAAEYWSSIERQTLNDLYDALIAQLEALSGVTAAPSLAPASATSMSTNNAGQYSQSQQLSQQSQQSQQLSQQSQQSQQLSQQSQQSSQNLNQFSQEPPMPNHFQWMENAELKQTYGNLTQELASDPEMENDSMFMSELEKAENEMSARGFLNNNGMQGAPRKLGILSGGLGGATTSTSSSSAHGPMRAHVARMNQADPRKDLYEY